MIGGQDVWKRCHRSLAGSVFHGIFLLNQECQGQYDSFELPNEQSRAKARHLNVSVVNSKGSQLSPVDVLHLY